MNAARRSFAVVVVLLAAEWATLMALIRLGGQSPYAMPDQHLQRWLSATAPADALIAVLRVVAIAGAGWILLTTALYALACLSRVPPAVRATRWATIPLVRRVVDAALVVTVAGASTMAPWASTVARAADASSVSSDTVAVPVRDGRSGGVASLPAESASPPTSSTLPPETQRAIPVAPSPSASPSAPTGSVMVTPGDNLWDLSAAEVARATRRAVAELDDGEIAQYWELVCTTNRTHLHSGDPSLIYPGEIITLPPLR